MCFVNFPLQCSGVKLLSLNKKQMQDKPSKLYIQMQAHPFLIITVVTESMLFPNCQINNSNNSVFGKQPLENDYMD